ncbi:NAD(P)-dependent benzaldehyde dehydrogenase MdlD [Acinetobacter rudis]|uniref:Aldehyde dehydrogenase n=1 Tax=Acinetobacter rudis TaxID=632955 RepID=A0AAW8J5A1_9GAMM|nr:aldehyde dehydrogenase family protein [Acinetobacter rudis]MDQ8934361.1 aldehyde dehydrogenase family protein [Acinetobacter rudis]MDQ8952001.1 aldehyde dehydrogenase family protein [Acinetobacter rudis]MDQ9016739.1 aldehyde dehydrogenase family protein [Acinetobacter rudis]
MKFTDQKTIQSIFNQQKAFFASGATKDLAFKKAQLHKLKDAVLSFKEQIYVALAQDLGKSKAFVDLAEIGEVVTEVDFALDHIDQWVQAEKVPTYALLEPAQCFVEHEAYGVTYIVCPFNYPVNLAFAPLVAAICAGNTAIIKPSENTPATSILIAEIVAATFAPEHVAVVQGAREENEFLLSLNFDLIFFTGSTTVGKLVMQAAAKNLTPCILELGGKSPFIVMPDADLDQTVAQLVFGKCANSGQTCVAPDYLMVHESIKKDLLDKLIAKLKTDFPDVDSNGKVISSQQIQRLADMLEHTGGEVAFGGAYDVEQRYFQATVVDQVDWNDALMQQELFGPILPVLSFSDINLAIEAINFNHPKPLAAYVFSKNTDQARQVLSKIPAGDVIVNGVMLQAFSPYLPFGGSGLSGIGDYHGYYGYLAFTYKKSVVVYE